MPKAAPLASGHPGPLRLVGLLVCALAGACGDTVDNVPDLGPACLPSLPDAGAASLDPECPVRHPPEPDTFDDALALAGLDRCTLGFSEADWSFFPPSIRSDAMRLPWYDEVHDHAVRAPAFGRALVEDLDRALGAPMPVATALVTAAPLLGPPLDPCRDPLPLAAVHPLAEAVAELVREGGDTPDTAALEADAADLPPGLEQAVARVVLAAGAANRAWMDLAAGLSSDDLGALSRLGAMVAPATYRPPKVSDAQVQDLLAHRFDETALLDGAARLAAAIETAGLARFAGTQGFRFDQPTPLGRVVVRDAAADTYEAADPPMLVLIDTGGDDVYRIPAGAIDATNDLADRRHVAVLIDLAGRDEYGYDEVPASGDAGRLPSDADGRYRPDGPPTGDNGPVSLSETPRQGAARMGYGFLFDLGPEADLYRSLRFSQGAAVGGVGVLYDAGGDDVYEAEAMAQGAAAFGVGLLLDAGGNDTYRTYTLSQGFAYVRAAGLLLDGAGDDRYLADVGDPEAGGDPLYYTPQLPGKGNSSFVQGAGFGRRAPGQNGDLAYLSGGIGVLRDRSGDDAYTASVFGQGTGYWFGTGLLADGGGSDSYDGKWYVQGSAAHFALALFLEAGGDDRYNPTLTPAATSIGVGHDFSVAWHIDSGGDDRYVAPGLSLGAGNANGVGVLINLGGDDGYHSPGEPTLGCGNLSGEVDKDPARREVPTTGLFVDVGGHDLYDTRSNIVRGDDTDWINVRQPPDAGVTTEHGAGVDRSSGSVTLP